MTTPSIHTDPLAVIILAGGRGKRMGSDAPKVVLKTREDTLIGHVLTAASTLQPERLIVVTGYKAPLVEQACLATKLPTAQKITFAHQAEQKGTGDAARSALSALSGFTGTVLILYGDAPLIGEHTLRALLKKHAVTKATITVLSFLPTNVRAYGRVVRESVKNKEGDLPVAKIVETKDCTESELLIRECNSGIYAIDSSFLPPALADLSPANAQGEYYLTDIIERAAREGQRVAAMIAPDPDEVEGVNTPSDLALVNDILARHTRSRFIDAGVILEDPHSCHIEPGVTIAPGVVIGPNVVLKGTTELQAGVVIEGSAYLYNAKISEGTKLKCSVRIEDSTIGARCIIGPFAHIRPGTELLDEAHVGNFVETKKAKLGKGVKANHLSYLGDCTIGARTNVGAGTITCNYDGTHKHHTTIGEDVFIGSDTCLIAPITVEDRAQIGAGSVLSKDPVEKDALTFTRSPRIVKKGWKKKG